MSTPENDLWSDINNPNNDASMDDWADAHNPNNESYLGCDDDGWGCDQSYGSYLLPARTLIWNLSKPKYPEPWSEYGAMLYQDQNGFWQVYFDAAQRVYRSDRYLSKDECVKDFLSKYPGANCKETNKDSLLRQCRSLSWYARFKGRTEKDSEGFWFVLLKDRYFGEAKIESDRYNSCVQCADAVEEKFPGCSVVEDDGRVI